MKQDNELQKEIDELKQKLQEKEFSEASRILEELQWYYYKKREKILKSAPINKRTTILPHFHIIEKELNEIEKILKVEKPEDTRASMDILTTGQGDFVKFYTVNAGHDWQKEDIQKRLTLGEIYEVDFLEIHGWHTDVYLKGFDKPFNSVFFRNIGNDTYFK